MKSPNIRISTETYDLLGRLKFNERETFNNVIERLIEQDKEAKKWKKQHTKLN